VLFNLLYLTALIAMAPRLVYQAVRHGKVRGGWNQKLFGRIDVAAKAKRRVWLHAVSVGEINLAAGLINRWHDAIPDGAPEVEFVISTSTVTGYELARRRFSADRVFYCPFDLTWAIGRTLRLVDPDLIVLVELEVWPNWIRMARLRNIPVAVVNGRLSDNSFRGYRRFDRILRPTFARLSLVAAQDETYADRFRQLGTPAAHVVVTGSTKFDDAPLSRQTAEVDRLRRLSGSDVGDNRIFLAGSTQAGEERIALAAFAQVADDHPNLRMILVPRHAERFDTVASEIESSGFQCRRRSQLRETESPWQSRQVLLVDSIGELRHWWGLADVAFVGGSLGDRGGQNMLEPAGYGAAVCFGPNTRNFRDIVRDLLAGDAARVVTDSNSMARFLSEMLADPDRAESMGHAAQRLIRQHQGAGRRTVDLLASCLTSRHP
jgi:3-deoxy-D-manno-octulosonic-acid transferase